MEVDRPHLKEAKQQLGQKGPNLEPLGKEKEGKTFEHLAKGPRGRHQADGIQPARIGEDLPGPWQTLVDRLSCNRVQ